MAATGLPEPSHTFGTAFDTTRCFLGPCVATEYENKLALSFAILRPIRDPAAWPWLPAVGPLPSCSPGASSRCPAAELRRTVMWSSCRRTAELAAVQPRPVHLRDWDREHVAAWVCGCTRRRAGSHVHSYGCLQRHHCAQRAMCTPAGSAGAGFGGVVSWQGRRTVPSAFISTALVLSRPTTPLLLCQAFLPS